MIEICPELQYYCVVLNNGLYLEVFKEKLVVYLCLCVSRVPKYLLDTYLPTYMFFLERLTCTSSIPNGLFADKI